MKPDRPDLVAFEIILLSSSITFLSQAGSTSSKVFKLSLAF